MPPASSTRLPPNGSARVAYSRGVPAVAQASQILFCLASGQRPQQTLTEICRQVGIHKSKGYAILNTLRDFGLVVRDETAKTYTLGHGLLALSRSVLDHSDLRSGVSPFLQRLSSSTACTALLGLIQRDRVVVVARHEPEAGVPVAIRLGHRYPLTWGAHGKAIAAFLPDEERERQLAGEKVYFGGEGASATDTVELRQELEESRRKGYALDLGHMQAGVSAASAPVFGSGSEVIGAVMAVGTFGPGEADAVGREAVAVAGDMSRFLGPTLQSLYVASA